LGRYIKELLICTVFKVFGIGEGKKFRAISDPRRITGFFFQQVSSGFGFGGLFPIRCFLVPTTTTGVAANPIFVNPAVVNPIVVPPAPTVVGALDPRRGNQTTTPAPPPDDSK